MYIENKCNPIFIILNALRCAIELLQCYFPTIIISSRLQFDFVFGPTHTHICVVVCLLWVSASLFTARFCAPIPKTHRNRKPYAVASEY